jgi:hypothetical protein
MTYMFHHKRRGHFINPISLIGLLLLSCLSVAHATTIQGSVFLDENNNTVWDTGELVRPNAIVYIVDEALEKAGQGGYFTVQTDANGNYWSFGHNTGTFRMWIDIPAGMKQTTPVRGEGQLVHHWVTLTSPDQTRNVDFGLFGDQGGITVNPDDSVTVKDRELTMQISPDKTATTSTEMKVTRKGEKYEGTNSTSNILVQPNQTKSGFRDSQDSFTIVTGKNISDTGEASSLEVTSNRDGSYTLKNAEFPTMVTTLGADSSYTVTDTDEPGMAFTVNADGSSTVTDEASPGMVASLDSEGDTIVTDEAFPGMAATVNGDGSYIVMDKALPGLKTIAHPDGSYTFIDAEDPTIEVTLDTDGNYTVIDTDAPEVVLTVFEDGNYMLVDNESGSCLAVEPSRTRGIFSGIKNLARGLFRGFKRIIGKIGGFVAKVARFVGKVAKFVAKVVPYVAKVARGVAAVARFLVPFMPFACKFLCAIAAFADGVAAFSDKVAQFANKVADIAGKVEKGANTVAVWANKGAEPRRVKWRSKTIRRPIPMPANCETSPFVLLDYSTASVSSGNVRLEWRTLVEVKNTGFNLWRAMKNEAGEFINLTKLNGSLIPAKGDTQKSASYTFEDNRVAPGITYYYTIEDIDTNGEKERHDDMRVEVKPLSISPAACHLLYGVQDQGLNDSIFFTINPDTGEIKPLGEKCKECDIEAMDIHPETQMIYVASGNDSFGHPKGHLYKLDGQTGELMSVGSTGFKEIGGLAFDLEGLLWAWAKDAGLIQLDTKTGEGTLVFDSGAKLADLTWTLSSNLLYGSVGKELWRYDPADKTVAKLCNNLPQKTEALEVLPTSILPEGFLLLGSHKNQAMRLHAFDVNRCKIVANRDIAMPYDDPEGLAMPLATCMP